VDTIQRGDRGVKAERLGGEREGDFMDNFITKAQYRTRKRAIRANHLQSMNSYLTILHNLCMQERFNDKTNEDSLHAEHKYGDASHHIYS
jgi:hypothetical protein